MTDKLKGNILISLSAIAFLAISQRVIMAGVFIVAFIFGRVKNVNAARLLNVSSHIVVTIGLLIVVVWVFLKGIKFLCRSGACGKNS